MHIPYHCATHRQRPKEIAIRPAQFLDSQECDVETSNLFEKIGHFEMIEAFILGKDMAVAALEPGSPEGG